MHTKVRALKINLAHTGRNKYMDCGIRIGISWMSFSQVFKNPFGLEHVTFSCYYETELPSPVNKL